MLRSLHIRNYVLIDFLDIDFPEGLVIVTGQTGAGKSILLGALSLLSGAKADAGAIASGKDSCVVEAVFGTENGTDEMKAVLDEAEIDWDPEQLIIRRTVNSTGRSRCFVNDTPTQLGVLEALSSLLIDIHSQHQSLLLCDRKFQLGVLDNFCGNTEKLARCRSVFRELQEKRKECSELELRLENLNSESDYKRAQYEQLKAAGIRPGELASLEEEQKQLSNAEMIKDNLCAAAAAFSDDDMHPGIGASLKEASRALQKVSAYVQQAASLEERLESARIEIEDIAQTVEELNQKTDLSEERLLAVDDRLSLLYSLLKKHRCTTEDGLISLMKEYSAELAGPEELEERIGSLRKEISTLAGSYEHICTELHEARVSGAGKFAESIQESLRYLELDRSVFLCEIGEGPDGAWGRDTIELRFSSNGTNPVNVSKCASGGEISRIMLCLKAMMARFTGMPTLIFDEIDTGVSGSVADKMGSMICQMGRDMQVFSITHLPQVAAKGDAHYVVSKEYVEGRAVSGIRAVSGEDRIMEIARLLSGSSITPEAVANARSLLTQAS